MPDPADRGSRQAPRRLLVWGASGHGKVVAEAARLAGYRIVAFVDDDPGKAGTSFFGAPVFHGVESLDGLRREATHLIIAVGDNAVRERLQRLAVEHRFEVPLVVHPSAVVSPDARLGSGTVVMAAAAVNPDAEIGLGVILNTAAVVEHDCRVDDFAHLSPNSAIGGGVHIGPRVSLGLGAVVLPGCSVGSDAVVGAGAVVIRPVPAGAVVAGVPAALIRIRNA